MEPLKEYGATELSLDNCVIPNERLLNTPSSRDGCSHELEVDLRIVGCEYIQSAGLLLKLPQVAMATAQVLFQRFYYSKSFVKYSIQPLAMAAIFLAAKIEENFRRLREVINVFHHLKQKRMGRPIVPMEYMGEEYFKTKSSVVKYERFLLKELGFCVHVKHPHKLVVTYLQMLDLQDRDQSTLVQRAWNNMNDSLRTNVFVRFTPETIACACIFLAARQLKVSLPQRPPWWQVFGAKQKDLEAISFEILALYTRPKKLLDTLEKEVSVLKEKLAKKQVEIKEVNIKKITTSASPETSSPQASEQALKPEDKAPSKSPLAVSSLQAPKTSSKNPSPLTQSQSSKEPPPIKNGQTSPEEKPHKRTHSPIIFHNEHKSISDHSRSRSPPTGQMISSPLRVSSSGSDQDRPGSASPTLNGIPERYRRDLEQERHQRKRHKHRTEKHQSKHSRKYKSHDNHERRRDQYYDHREEYERSSSSKNYRKRGKDYEREYYSSSKIRKIDRHR